MGKKPKVGKARKDKFYQLAKETGYRSRASFKLIQLNKKFGFLNKSRVVIDLCAAPGGWMQVVAQNTPVSSVIVGVDLVSIRPVDRCITLQEDITTDKCRQSLKKALQTWQADVVLNDGAPNVGKNWVFDAYNQSELTLSALKLATEFLRKGGWFVTKVFRSKDYFALNWVFQQLFRKVWATKPQASRNESAEIFVVCENFLAPDRLDPKFLDPKHVFKDVNLEPNRLLNLMHPEKQTRHREGYAEGDYTLFHSLKASEYIRSESFMEKLAACNMIELDDENIANNPATTEEIKQCLADIKVLGKKEIKAVLNWRKVVLKDLEKAEKEAQKAAERENEGDEEDEEMSDHEKEEEELDEVLAKAHEEDKKTMKRKKRKERKLMAKKRQRLDMKMDLPGDKLDFGEDAGVFSLSKIRTKKDLAQVQAGDLSFMDGDIVEDDDDADADKVLKKRRLLEAYDKTTKRYIDISEFPSDEEGEEEPTLDDMEDVDDNSEDDEEVDNNPLVVEMESKEAMTQSRAASWFSKGAFEGLEREEDEDVELQAMTADYEERGGTVLGKRTKNEKKTVQFAAKEADSDDDDDDDDEAGTDDDDDDFDDESDDVSDDGYDSPEDDDDDLEAEPPKKRKKLGPKSAGKSNEDNDELEVVPVDRTSLKLNPVGLAMGTAMVCSKKRRRDIIESGYNRYMRGEDEDLPDWFAREEKKHNQRQMPVTKEEVEEYKLKQRAIDARPIKKLAEAKARKKKKLVRRLEKARKKAEAVGDAGDVSEKEKVHQMKQIYKKAGLLGQKKQETTYVVAKKGMGKRARRPQGVKGRYKIVDPRMKKDQRSMKASANKGKGKKNRGGKAKGKQKSQSSRKK